MPQLSIKTGEIARNTTEMDRTAEFYQDRAREYADSTLGIDMQNAYSHMLSWVPTGGTIVDAGCGSGRDARAFVAAGYRVIAYDSSEALARIAGDNTGLEVGVMRHEDFAVAKRVDAIWCSASMLHCPRADWPAILGRFSEALEMGGVLYVSVKMPEAGAGNITEQLDGNGRWFTSMTVDGLRETIEAISPLVIVDKWTAEDVRPGTTWACVVAQKPRFKR